MEWLLISKSQTVELFWPTGFITCMQTFQRDSISLNAPELTLEKHLQGIARWKIFFSPLCGLVELEAWFGFWKALYPDMESFLNFSNLNKTKNFTNCYSQSPFRIPHAHSAVYTGLKSIKFRKVVELIKILTQLRIEVHLFIVTNIRINLQIMCQEVLSQPA